MRRTVVVAWLLLGFCVLPGAVRAQDVEQEPGPASLAPASDADPGVPTQPVAVGSPVDDTAIAERLQRILQSSQRFEGLEVRVENGVVFLAGTTSTEAYKDWAGQLVLRTEDVTALVNDLRVTSPELVESARHEVINLWRALVDGLPLALFGLGVFLVTLLLSRTLARLFGSLLTRRIESQLLQRALVAGLQTLLILGGLYFFLRIAGLTRIATTIIGGTGLLGLVLGLAFRDIAENVLASLLISIQRPFRLGDTVEVDGHQGIVQRVTLRGTVLMDYDGNHIQIPNATIYKNTIRNFTANPKRRIRFDIGVGYDTDIETAQGIAKSAVAGHSAVLEDPAPSVLVEQLGAATVVLRVFAWINGREHSPPRVRSAIMRLVLSAFEEQGVSLPDEAREVIFPDGVPVRMLEAAAKSGDTSAGGPTGRPVSPPPTADPAVEVSDGEGDLASEDIDLAKQARESRNPDEGLEIMGTEDDAGG